MKPFRDMTYAELRSAFRARCIGWLAAHDDDNDMAMFCHASIMGLILEEWDKHLRARAGEARAADAPLPRASPWQGGLVCAPRKGRQKAPDSRIRDRGVQATI